MKRLLALLLALCLLAVPAMGEMGSVDEGNPPLAPAIFLKGNPATGYAWTADILDPNMLELTSEENAAGNSDLLGAPGTYTATLKGTFEQAGSTEISFAYSRGAEELAESRTVDVFVNESNELFIERVSVLNLLP